MKEVMAQLSSELCVLDISARVLILMLRPNVIQIPPTLVLRNSYTRVEGEVSTNPIEELEETIASLKDSSGIILDSKLREHLILLLLNHWAVMYVFQDMFQIICEYSESYVRNIFPSCLFVFDGRIILKLESTKSHKNEFVSNCW